MATNREFDRQWDLLFKIFKSLLARGIAPIGLNVFLDTTQRRSQGYSLSIRSNGVFIRAADAAGAFYAAQTLRQLLRQFTDRLPCMEIEDYPDFATRGVMLDISRDKVPTMQTLSGLIDLLAKWKINQFQIYTEHTFAYSRHRKVWENASPMTSVEVRALDDYCRDRFIELVPNQNSFGHMERWLKHEEYQHLAEALDGADTPWGFRWKGPFSLCPTDSRSIELLRELYAELLPNFRSSLFNVGCDETFDIGQGRSREECEKRGTTRVYLEYLSRVNDLARAQGKTMMFWGDIILNKPEFIPDLPKNVIALNWGYEADHPFESEASSLAAAGVPFYVCPGTSSWNSITGRTENALQNLQRAAESGLKHGAIGYLNTDWGDNGHLQHLPFSYLGFAAGAGFSWCLESNRDVDWAAALDIHAFHDSSQSTGKAIYNLGNVYQLCGKPNRNGSSLFRVLVPPPNDSKPERGLTAEGLERAHHGVAAAVRLLGKETHSEIPRGDLTRLTHHEIRNAAEILTFAVEIARYKLGWTGEQQEPLKAKAVRITEEYSQIWLQRNRPGGLADSRGRLIDAVCRTT